VAVDDQATTISATSPLVSTGGNKIRAASGRHPPAACNQKGN
jgi:hypothetical protein